MVEKKKQLKVFHETKVWKKHKIRNPYEVVRFRHLLNFLETGSKEIVLDAGCGGGTYTNALAKAMVLIAVDFSSNAIRNAKQKSIPNENVFFIVCDLEQLPIRDNAIDKVASIDVLEHIERPQRVVDEISRVLSSHGQMLLFTAVGENRLTLEFMLKPFLGKIIKSIRSTLGHVSIFTTQGICSMLSKEFTINHIEYMHHWVGWLLKIFWDATHLNSREGHQSPFELSSSVFSRLLWMPLEAEYNIFKDYSLGTEIILKATKKQ